jgi:4-hydroxy-4-methyl-2-oxoglutarate aldolase
MKKLIVFFLFLFAGIFSAADAQERDKDLLAKGMNFIETRTYTPEDDAKILELYKNLRVADVSDGMDMVGLQGTGLVDPAIHPDWVDLKGFTQLIKPGTAVIIDDTEDKDIGSIGSNNILYWYKLGAVGVVTDAGARDTDEVGLEGVPLYLSCCSPGSC